MTVLISNIIRGPKIGNGSFGEVFHAVDPVHGAVAIKEMRQQQNEPNAAWELRKKGLLKEGQRLSQANHANVVRVHGILQSDKDDAVVLVMELCQNGSLQTAFEAGPMKLGDVQKVSTEVALGLHALHARGMLHRDIKPGNILLPATNIAKIGDFGLVTDNIIVGYGSSAGYADHLAPEVWNGQGTSIKSDVWALGMTIYRLIHGAEWYSRLTFDPSVDVCAGGFAKLLPWLPHVPKPWRRFVRTMMNDDTRYRYQDANQVINALGSLSPEPNWPCEVRADKIAWSRIANGRHIHVVWEKHSVRKYEWRAWSQPIGLGRRRTLGGSKGAISYSQSEKELRAFFAA